MSLNTVQLNIAKVKYPGMTANRRFDQVFYSTMAPTLIGVSGSEVEDEQLAALEFDESVDEVLGVKGSVGRGDTLRGYKVNGTGHGYCPFCRMQLPWKFLVVKNNLNHQSLGYCCSMCMNPLIAMTKIKGTNRVVKRWMEPKLAQYIAARQALYRKKPSGRGRFV